MKRTHTMTAVAVATGMLALAACGSGGASDDDTGAALANDAGSMADYGVGDQFTATEPLSFPILYSDHPNYPIQDDWMLWQEIEERANVTLEPTVVPMSDYEQKRSLLVGAGDAPLILPKTYPGQEAAFVSSGAILPVSDYIDLMPNFKDKVERWGLDANLDTLRQEDGKYYVLPGLHEAVWQDYTIAVRTDIMEELGLEQPKDWDEFRDMLAAMKAAYPDVYPLSDRFSIPTPTGNLLNLLGMTYGTSAGWGYANQQWDEEAGEFVFPGTTDEYREMVEYLHGLVEDGLVDPESFTQDDDSAIQKLANGKSFAISTNAQTLVNDYRPALAATLPDAEISKIRLPAGPAGDVVSGTSLLENGLMISSDAKDDENFVAMMQFIDWLWYSDEGQEFAKWGVEGTTYTKDADGTRVLDPGIDFIGLNPGAPKHLQKDFGFSGGVFAYGGTTDLLWSTFSDEEVAFQESMADKEVLPLQPPFPFDEIEREQATLLETPLKDTVQQGTLQFVLGQRDLSEWDAYVAEIEAKGSTQYIELVNAAHERYAEANG
jgi:putative aldouronate transport system substrate-binding protein